MEIVHAVPDWVLVLIAAPFGGSFLGLLATRLPEGRPVVIARSACDRCGAVLGLWELAPLVSYAAQLGRCRRCGGLITVMHPLMELGCLCIAGWAAALMNGPALYASCALGWVLLALALCDARSFMLPDALTLPLLLLGLAATAWLAPRELIDHAMAAAFGYSLFRGLSLVYRRVCGREGLGAGDAKLLAAAGAWLGLLAIPEVMLIAALAGLAWVGARALFVGGMTRDTAVPFGPALALGIWLIWLYA